MYDYEMNVYITRQKFCLFYGKSESYLLKKKLKLRQFLYIGIQGAHRRIQGVTLPLPNSIVCAIWKWKVLLNLHNWISEARRWISCNTQECMSERNVKIFIETKYPRNKSHTPIYVYILYIKFPYDQEWFHWSFWRSRVCAIHIIYKLYTIQVMSHDIDSRTPKCQQDLSRLYWYWICICNNIKYTKDIIHTNIHILYIYIYINIIKNKCTSLTSMEWSSNIIKNFIFQWNN